ncbi:pirin family protein [Neolewinella persica]|uniref:pirin family protein n=1 Tax=Neolewinella persica TaxID=70998 RepID=UPI00037C49AA|nr:pirin family protein [Neolewinella persica]
MSDPILAISPLGPTWQTLDPFLFSVHHHDLYPEGNEQLGPLPGTAGRRMGQDFGGKDGWSMYHGQTVPGFPHHPHRGFETITVVEQGYADHTDSLGATGRFGKGDVQWMTAGKGVLHAEMFPLINEKEGNTLELFQIWLNLPRKNKMVSPNYKMLWSEDIPVVKLPDAAGKVTTVKIIAGDLGDTPSLAPPPHSWAADANNHLAVWIINMEPGGSWTLPATAAGINRALYMYNGDRLQAADQSVANYHAIQVDSGAEIPLVAGKEPVSMLLLQARPINEPVVQHGPFVMNTQEEIALAFAEYRKTQFGGWPWPSEEHVHDRDRGRFARYPDGTTEERS